MKPIRSIKSFRLPALEMYREDLDELIALLRQGCRTVVIKTESHEYDSLDELKNTLGPKVTIKMSIVGYVPGVLLVVNHIEQNTSKFGFEGNIYNQLSTFDLNDEADNVYYRIKDYLTTKERPLIKRWAYLVIGVIFFASATALFLNPDVRAYPFSFGAGMVLLPAMCVISTTLSTGGGNRIFLGTRVESPSFWERNKDDILSKGIVGVVTALLGFILGRMSIHK